MDERCQRFINPNVLKRRLRRRHSRRIVGGGLVANRPPPITGLPNRRYDVRTKRRQHQPGLTGFGSASPCDRAGFMPRLKNETRAQVDNGRSSRRDDPRPFSREPASRPESRQSFMGLIGLPAVSIVIGRNRMASRSRPTEKCRGALARRKASRSPHGVEVLPTLSETGTDLAASLALSSVSTLAPCLDDAST